MRVFVLSRGLLFFRGPVEAARTNGSRFGRTDSRTKAANSMLCRRRCTAASAVLASSQSHHQSAGYLGPVANFTLCTAHHISTCTYWDTYLEEEGLHSTVLSSMIFVWSPCLLLLVGSARLACPPRSRWLRPRPLSLSPVRLRNGLAHAKENNHIRLSLTDVFYVLEWWSFIASPHTCGLTIKY